MDPETLLQRVCRDNDTHTLQLLISMGVPLEGKNECGYTPLMIGSHHPQIVKTLLECGVNSDIQDNNGNTPLHYAVVWNKKEIATLLLEAGADRNIRNNKGLKCTDIFSFEGDETIRFIENYVYQKDEEVKEPGCD